MISPDTLASIVDFVVAFTLLEGVALAAYHRATGRGVSPRDFGLNLLSGLCLMLALRSLARDAGVAWVALFLLAAGIAHGSDLLLRWRRDARAERTPREVAT